MAELPRRVAVTGGAGFIGAHVVRALKSRGVAVSVLVLPGDEAQLLQGLDVVKVVGDVATGEGLDALMKDAGGVFHLAAIYALWLAQPQRMFDVNVQGTRQVLAAARRAGIGRVVHTSSMAAVGYEEGEESADETTVFVQDELANDYILSKAQAEEVALAEADDGLEVVAVNPSFPIGPGDLGPTPTGRIIRAMARGLFPMTVPGGMNAVDVRDVAEGHLLAFERGRSGERYLLAGENMTNAEVARVVAEAVGKKPPQRMIPGWALFAVAGAVEWTARLVTRTDPLLTRRSVAYTAGRHLYFDNRKAREELGFTPRPAEIAIRDAVRWFEDTRQGPGRAQEQITTEDTEDTEK